MRREQAVFEAVKAILKLSPEKAANVLQQAVDNKDKFDAHSDLLASEEVAECIDKEDMQAYSSHLEQLQAARDLVGTTREFLQTEAKSKNRCDVKRKPCNFEAVETWTAEMAETMAPPHSKFYRDQWNKRWLVWCGEGPINTRWCRSRSWGITGDDNRCIEELLKLAWKRHEELTGEPCPINFHTPKGSVSEEPTEPTEKASSSSSKPQKAAKK